ncbi:hypothetical protein D1007_32360 [Hordeum vulgare]|nr:hypothetical protein D1007_32360 [Hordeum vulgare]
MQYTGPTYRFPPIVREMLYPAGVYVESTLHVWAMSRWRGAREFTDFFLGAGYGHLTRGSPRIYRVRELLGRVFCCACEFIAFTHHIFMDYDNIFPTAERMHTLSYRINNTAEEH